MNGNRASDDHHHRREIQSMKGNPCDDAPALHDIQRKSEDIGAIAKVAFQFEMHPAENQREGNQRREDAAPHDEEVHGPARKSALEDKFLLDEICGKCPGGGPRVTHDVAVVKIKFPTTLPID